MKSCGTYLSYFAVFIIGLFFLSTIASAGSFRDFILNDQENETNLAKVQIPANSRSSTCIECHSGNHSSAITLKHANARMSFSGHGSSNHPVGMNYEQYARSNPRSFVPTHKLDPRIILEEGQVTCVSCHQTKLNLDQSITLNEQNSQFETCGASKELTTSSNQTGLCMSCHSI